MKSVPLGKLSDLDPRSPRWVQKKLTQPEVSHVWFEDISFRSFPGKLKIVGRTEAAAETDQEQKVPRLPYPEWLNKDFILKHQTCRTDVIWNLLLRYYIWAILINIFTLVKDIVPRWACQPDNPIGITFWFIVWKFMADAVHSLMLFLYIPNVFLL